MARKLTQQSRIVHLAGGLRAIDNQTEFVSLQLSATVPLARFPTPAYADLYATLASVGLAVVGVEFLGRETLRGEFAPDWECFFASTGFRVLNERRAWSEIRYAANTDGKPVIVDVAARCQSYLDLLSIRLLQLSRSYNDMLLAWRAGRGIVGNHFSNTFMPYIDAAIHGFLSDAASLRDLIAEIVWRFILSGDGSVRTLSALLKKAKTSAEPVVREIVTAGQEGHWLKQFTDLRNDVVHVAPVGQSSPLHSCQVRQHDCRNGVILPKLHYPILAGDGTIWKNKSDLINSDDDSIIIAAVRRYDGFLSTSIDGLDYTWQTLAQMVDILCKVREAIGFRRETATITAADIIGKVRLR